MLDPIETATVRLAWARKHIEDFETEWTLYATLNSDELVPYIDPQTGECILRVEFREPFPVRLSLLAGDAVHELRTILDGLFWALAQKYGITDDVTFPLRVEPDKFLKEVRNRKLFAPFPDSVWKEIEDLQPYNGGKILRIIHELDIAHKHRAILVTASTPTETTIKGNYIGDPMVCVGPIEHGSVVARVMLPIGRVKVHAKVTFTVTFGEVGEVYGKSVRDVLMVTHDSIHDGVTAAFKRMLAE